MKVVELQQRVDHKRYGPGNVVVVGDTLCKVLFDSPYQRSLGPIQVRLRDLRPIGEPPSAGNNGLVWSQ